MNIEIWASIATAVATLVLFIVPVLIYSWHVLEHMIDDEKSYPNVMKTRRVTRIRPNAAQSADRNTIEHAA
jgi:hypothetical protein